MISWMSSNMTKLTYIGMGVIAFIGLISIVFFWISSVVFKRNINIFSNILQLQYKDSDTTPLLKYLKKKEYGDAINWVFQRKMEGQRWYSLAMVLEESLTPFGLAGTVLGILLTFQNTKASTTMDQLYPNLALAIITTLAGIGGFIIVKIFSERPASSNFVMMSELADSLLMEIHNRTTHGDPISLEAEMGGDE